MLSTTMKFNHLRFTLDCFTLKNKEGGRAGHPFVFLLIQLLRCLMVIFPGGGMLTRLTTTALMTTRQTTPRLTRLTPKMANARPLCCCLQFACWRSLHSPVAEMEVSWRSCHLFGSCLLQRHLTRRLATKTHPVKGFSMDKFSWMIKEADCSDASAAAAVIIIVRPSTVMHPSNNTLS